MNNDLPTAEKPEASTPSAWGDPIDEAHKQALWARLQAWWQEADHGERKGPFAGEKLTGAEVFWLAVYALSKHASCSEQEAERRLRLRLSAIPGQIIPTANLSQLQLHGVDLSHAQLQQADLPDAQLQGACLCGTQLQNANLEAANLQGAYLEEAQLQGANLYRANLQRSNIGYAQLQGAGLEEAQLQGANLCEAFLDTATNLGDVTVSTPETGCVRVVDARWGGVNLAILKVPLLPCLGDEQIARQWQFQPLKAEEGQPVLSQAAQEADRTSQAAERLDLFRAATRANRQVAMALQSQGMDDEAAKFAYHARLCQQIVYRLDGCRTSNGWRKRTNSWRQYLWSCFLWAISGYGYRPLNSVVAYLVIILGFMGFYLLNAQFVAPHLTWDEALVLSVSSFHGRGFFSQSITLGDTYARLAALEAVFGLLIEISFIATFTQRFFGSK